MIDGLISILIFILFTLEIHFETIFYFYCFDFYLFTLELRYIFYLFTFEVRSVLHFLVCVLVKHIYLK
jgi:hypothetical protein